jgi:hypothetical protein
LAASPYQHTQKSTENPFKEIEKIMSSIDGLPFSPGRKTTPPLNSSPQGKFDPQTAVRALKNDDLEDLVRVLSATKWEKPAISYPNCLVIYEITREFAVINHLFQPPARQKGTTKTYYWMHQDKSLFRC